MAFRSPGGPRGPPGERPDADAGEEVQLKSVLHAQKAVSRRVSGITLLLCGKASGGSESSASCSGGRVGSRDWNPELSAGLELPFSTTL